jgi:hypothetical protein
MGFGLLIVVSLIAGFVGALAGMGGGVVLIPALTFLGVDIKHAVAVSMLSVIATSSGAASAYVRDHITNLRVGMFLEMFTILGALAGASMAVAASQRILFLVFGLVLLATWITLFFQHGEEWRPVPKTDRFSRWLALSGQYYDGVQHRMISYRVRWAHVGAVLMFGAGIIAGLLGIGAGALKVLIHDLLGLPPKVSTTTSNLIIGVTALAGTSVYLSAGLIDPKLAGPVILGVSAGALAGTKVLVRLSNLAVRRFFLVVLVVLGVEMLLRAARG